MTDWIDFDCDLCGSGDAAEIEVARGYTGGHPLHVCRACGFVYVRRRRSAQAIADSWSDDLYAAKYTARIPAVKARQVFVAEMIDTTIGLRGKSLLDIGAGEGQFMAMVRGPDYGAAVFGIEPSAANGRLMADQGLPHAVGTIESFAAAEPAAAGRYDIVTIMWTLENCQSCRVMLDAAHRLLKPGGHVVVATGSRILVPFKKPLHYYLGANAPDTHAFRFSRNSLERALARSAFGLRHVNRAIDHDVLCMIGERLGSKDGLPRPTDDANAVIDFFRRWHQDTEAFYKGA